MGGSPKQTEANMFPRSLIPDVNSPRFYNRLAILLGFILFLQILFRAPDDVHVEHTDAKAELQAYDNTLLAKWTEFQAQGGRLSDTSVPLSTRRLQLHTQADVEGANIDHNMSISNPCVSTTDLLKRAYLQPLPAPFSSFGQHRFIMRSGYRTSPRDFVVVGLQLLSSTRKVSDLELRRPQKGECFWVGVGGREIEGRFKSVYPGEHHELMYETVVHRCHLEEPTTGKGGGVAIMSLDGERSVMYSEGPNAPDIYREPDVYLGFCSFPMYRGINAVALHDWLIFHHHYAGVEYFVMQDGSSVDFDVYPVLEPWVKAGVMEIVDMRGEFKYETKHNVIALNDCMYRLAYKAHWVLFLDFDEYLYTAPPMTLTSVLQESTDAPYVTFGSLWWSVDLCRNPGAPYLERMLFHWPHFYCVGEHVHYRSEKCINYYGHRKFLVNPRLVEAVQVHRPIEPKEGGVDLEVTVSHMNHFQGILRADKPLCKDPQEPGKKPDWWAEDTKIMDAWKLVKHKTQPIRKR